MKKVTEADYIKAVRRADREIELEMHGKIISISPVRIRKSKKSYTRKLKHLKKFSENLLQD